METSRLKESVIYFNNAFLIYSGIGPQYGKRATMIFACGDQTFFKVDESILTGAMLPKINVVANKSTICKFYRE